MKMKVFLAAVAVAFSFAVTSCGNKKAADAEATAVADVTAVQACDSTMACCKADAATCTCDSTCCKENAECAKACEKECAKACDKK